MDISFVDLERAIVQQEQPKSAVLTLGEASCASPEYFRICVVSPEMNTHLNTRN